MKYQPNFKVEVSEDFDFCDRACALGYRVTVNWEAKVGHHKPVNLDDFEEYARAARISRELVSEDEL